MGTDPTQIAHWKSRRDQRCGNCDAFVNNSIPGAANNTIGLCCLHPPMAFVSHGANPQAAINPKAPPVIQLSQSMWPPVRIDQWCRDWEPKVEGEA